MAALPSPTQVAGSHTAIYEAYYNQVDPNGCGRIGAMEAARFLKKSQLSDVVLSKIWDMADPQSRGSLDKSGLFVALKLCALAQAGRNLSMANLALELPPPKMGEIPVIPQKPVVNALPVITSVNNGDWSIKPSERAKYDQLFDSLQPSNGYIPGNKVKGVLMDSKLPLDTLGKIWDLADMDKDGMLDRHEFVVAMHLVYKALEKYAIPSVLPPELMPPGKRKDSVPVSKSPVPMGVITTAPPPIPPLPQVSSVKTLAGLDAVKPPAQQWVVSNEDRMAADTLFLQADMDMDGYVSGLEIKDVFLQSGLPQSVLAHIWGLCDTCQSGKLNKEQFALAMWLIKQKLRGVDPPAALTPEMVPPSMRKPSEAVVENNNISGYSNPELDMISKDIAELVRERQSMEQDIAQKEADIKIKNGEIKSLQSELDTLAATLKQLENQKGEAQKRLNDLKAQKADVDKDLGDVEEKIREEQRKVDKLRQQAEEQESVLRAQEEELNSKRQELEGLRQEEQQLEQQQNKSRDQLNELTKNLQDTQLQICQAKAKITHLQEQQRQMSDAIALYDSALAAGDATLVPDTSLQFNPEIEELEYDATTKSEEETKETKADSFSNANGTATLDEFGEQDLFASSKAKEAFSASTMDPFENAFSSQPATGGFTNDPFTAFDNSNVVKQDPFDPFGDGKRNDNKTSNSTAGGFTRDPFSAFDNSNVTKQDPFDPFGDGKRNNNKTPNTTTATKDPFGEDPLANLHAPPRPESPSPALPPKKVKQPPPRPAPPRPSQGPTGPLRAAPAPPTPSPTPDRFANDKADPFGAEQNVADNNNRSGFTTTSLGFADFANFSSKPEPVTSTNRAAPPRPAGRPLVQSARLPDFTEDPFRDYRYEDIFTIADPFEDESDDPNSNRAPPVSPQIATKIDSASKADAISKMDATAGQLDAFGYGASTNQKSTFEKGFDNDFSAVFPVKSRTTDSKDANKFEADFGKAFSDDNRNARSNEFPDGFPRPKTKAVDIDEAFSTKTERRRLETPGNNNNNNNSNNNSGHGRPRGIFGEKRSPKSEVGKPWRGNQVQLALTEEEQLAWASRQSIMAEEERRKRKEQEDAELALALELSKQEKSGKI